MDRYQKTFDLQVEHLRTKVVEHFVRTLFSLDITLVINGRNNCAIAYARLVVKVKLLAIENRGKIACLKMVIVSGITKENPQTGLFH